MISHPDTLLRFALERITALRQERERDRLTAVPRNLFDVVRTRLAPRPQAACCPPCCAAA